MAKLTPLSKGLIAVAIVAVAGAAAWQLGLKDLVTGDPGPADPSDGPTFDEDGPKAALGSEDNPLKVSIVSFHGYAPALVANGNSLTTQPGSIMAKNGVHVEFVIQDDVPTLTTIFASDTAQCAWRTSDFWAQEQPNLRGAGYDGRAIMVVDNTQGADAIIAKDPAIQSVEDLADRKVALLQYTPSDGMVIDAIDNSALSARKKNSVKYVYVAAEEGTAGVRAAFEAGHADAAALWDPDLSLALNAVPGAHVIYSTETATNLIYDVIVCDTRHLDNPANTDAYQAFVKSWMEGVTAAEANPDGAVDALVQTEEFFALLAEDEGRPFVKGLFSSLVWTGLEDNARILGMAGGTNHYERVYHRFDGIYRKSGALADPNAPVINPQDSFDYRFIEALLADDAGAKAAATKPEFTFTEVDRDKAHDNEAQLTKPITVNFATGSDELTKRAMQTIDEEMVPLIENHGSAYFEVSGNTDSTGSTAANQTLSERRANAVTAYLVEQWEFEAARFVVQGNGESKPLCNEQAWDGEYESLDDCRAANRSTRLAVHSAD
jgi:outer membrane protein OmpA-like peptidoglycan-associated protein/ABC-type nitrate/sulfonate/bicarbonate transport system substrate-binding protein